MGYYPGPRRRYTQARRTRQNNPELVARIEKVAARGISSLTDWERNFLASLLDSAKKWGRLSGKQHQVLQRIEKKMDPNVQAARRKWNDGFTPAMREKLKFAAEYYKANPPYFSDAASRILSDSNYIPPEKLYRKMVENKYVQRAFANSNAAPRFAPGSMATVRESDSVQGAIRRFRGQLVMVIEADDSPRTAVKGGRRVAVLPVGSTTTILTEERYLKNAKV